MTQGVWRPIQYLGSKLRSLDAVTSAISELAPADGTVFEPFTGSTVVAQSLAFRGYRIVACDALLASARFASALLGSESEVPDKLAKGIELVARIYSATRCPEPSLDPIWHPWIEAEDAARSDRDGAALLTVGSALPQRWRQTGASRALHEEFDRVDAAAMAKTRAPRGFASTTFAGTYFGIRQALRLDSLLDATFALQQSGSITPWELATAQTAICSAASRAVFSAGKHFAQPQRVREDKDLSFLRERVVADRSIDIDASFTEAVQNAIDSARPATEGHIALHKRVELLGADDLLNWGVNVTYADPPYTAQQYSRFYHLLDALLLGIPTRLQVVAGKVTRGLYSEDRYLSPFCSRRRAPLAFRNLFATSNSAGASCALSYSDSDRTGNGRMISLADLIEIAGSIYGRPNVQVERLSHTYRQFNSALSEVEGRSSPEFLIMARS